MIYLMVKQSGYSGTILSQGMGPSFCQELPLPTYEPGQGASALLRANSVVNNSAETLHQTTIPTTWQSPNSNIASLLPPLQPVDTTSQRCGSAGDWYLVQRCSPQLLGVEKMETFYPSLQK